MSADTQIAWSWLKSISRELFTLDATPLLGTCPPFSWERFSQEFAKAFTLDQFTITPQEPVWREKEAILKGVAMPAVCTQVTAAGMEGAASFWICLEDVEHLMAKALKISEVVSELQSEDVVTNFHKFLSIETVAILNSLGFDPRISFKITGYSKECPDAALCQDIMVTSGSEKMLMRLVLAQDFLSSWRAFFAKQEPPQVDLDHVECEIRLEAARTQLRFDDLLKITPGDLVLLDQVFYDPQAGKNQVQITLNGKPLFRAELNAGSLQILEISTQSEVHIPMVEQTPPPEQLEENPFEEVEENEDEGLELVEAAAQMPIEQLVKETPKTVKQPAIKEAEAPRNEALSANSIPVQLVVEVAAVNLSVQKLLELTPGNMLDLGIHPESGVNLVVNGRTVGRGELLKIGETLGVRILQIGV